MISKFVKVMGILCFIMTGTISMAQSLVIEVKDVLDLGTYGKPQVTTIKLGNNPKVKNEFIVKSWLGVPGMNSKDIKCIVEVLKTDVNSYLVYIRKETVTELPEVSVEFSAVLNVKSGKNKTKFTDSLPRDNDSAGHRQLNTLFLKN